MMRYEDVPVGQIKVKDRIRREMGDLQELADSFLEQDSKGNPRGIIQPLLVDTQYNLLAGGRRLAAAELAGMKVVPCMVRSIPTKMDAYEIELIENALRKDMTWVERAEAEKRIWDYKKDNGHWTLREQEDLLGTSKSLVRMRILLAEAIKELPDLANIETQDEAWKAYKRLEEEETISELVKKAPDHVKRASKWAKDHYVVGDAFRLMPQEDPKIADFAEVDTPYAVGLTEHVKARNKTKAHHEKYNEWDPDEFPTLYETVAKEVFRILKENAFAVFWFGPTWHTETLSILRKAGFTVPDIPGVWTKGAVGQTASPDTTFGSCYEPFWLARKGNPKLAKPGHSNVFDYKMVPSTKKVHTTEKPIALLNELFEAVLFPGSIVFVPFLGSGVSLRAAYAAGHTGWGYDMDARNKELFLSKVYSVEEPASDDV